MQCISSPQPSLRNPESDYDHGISKLRADVAMSELSTKTHRGPRNRASACEPPQPRLRFPFGSRWERIIRLQRHCLKVLLFGATYLCKCVFGCFAISTRYCAQEFDNSFHILWFWSFFELFLPKTMQKSSNTNQIKRCKIGLDSALVCRGGVNVL